ncbi:MAG: hypothetical protein LCH99_19195 [Proteobacteria bacterium]|nr:hypothetical protein [Pseudomonadota bacterium]
MQSIRAQNSQASTFGGLLMPGSNKAMIRYHLGVALELAKEADQGMLEYLIAMAGIENEKPSGAIERAAVRNIPRENIASLEEALKAG